MLNYPYKVLAMATVFTLATVNLTPSIQAMTQEQATTINHQQSQFDPPKIELKKQLTNIDNYYVTMQVYSQMVKRQADINLNSIDLKGDDKSLAKDLPEHQQTARGNAKYWDRNLKQELIKVNQSIISYDNQFQSYSQTLEKAIDDQDKTTIKQLIKDRLSKNAKTQQDTVNTLIAKLGSFDDKLTKDNRAFDTDGKKLVTILAGNDSLIKTLQQQIIVYNNTIDQSLKYLIGGALAMGVGIGIGGLGITLAVLSGGTLVPIILGVGALSLLAGGGYAAKENYDSMENAKNGLKQVTHQLSTARSALITLQEAQSSVGNLQETIKNARETLGHISTQWGTMSAKYDTLLTDIDGMSPEELQLIKTDLQVAKNSWADLRIWAEGIQNQLSAVNIATTEDTTP